MTTTNEQLNLGEAHCESCGGLVLPRAGRRWWQAGPDDGGDVGGRTPAGWQVTHLDAEACKAELEARRAKKAAAAAAADLEASERRAKFEAARERAEQPGRQLIASLGLEPVPADCNLCNSPGLEETYRATYSDPTRGASGMSDVVIRRAGDEAVVLFSTGGFSVQYATAALIRRGQSTFRVQRWWRADAYSATSYPGPNVQRYELSPAELEEVARLEQLKEAADREETERLAKIDLQFAQVDFERWLAKLTAKTSATVSVTRSDAKYVVRVSIPEAHWTKNGLRAPIAKLLPRDGYGPTRRNNCVYVTERS